MSIEDKKGFLDKIKNQEGKYDLDLGCGNREEGSNLIGVDRINYDHVDIVGDVFEILKEIPQNSINSIITNHFVEHLDDLEHFLNSCAEALIPGGKLEICVPHFSSPYFYSDPTHKNFFGLYTFCYFSNCSFLSRKVPVYEHKVSFNIEKIFLGFKSPKPFYFRYGIKRLVGSLFNSSYYMMEFWEENLPGIFPCYEISYVLVKEKGNKND